VNWLSHPWGPPHLRRQSLLRSPPLCRPEAHHQSRLQRSHDLRSRRRGCQLCAFVASRPDLWSGTLRETSGGGAARGATLPGATAIARFTRWPVFARHRGSLPPRYGRHGSIPEPSDPGTAGTDPAVRPGRCGRRNRKSRIGSRLRSRLCRQHPTPAAVAAKATTAASIARSLAQRTRHRSDLTAGIRRLHS